MSLGVETVATDVARARGGASLGVKLFRVHCGRLRFHWPLVGDILGLFLQLRRVFRLVYLVSVVSDLRMTEPCVR